MAEVILRPDATSYPAALMPSEDLLLPMLRGEIPRSAYLRAFRRDCPARRTRSRSEAADVLRAAGITPDPQGSRPHFDRLADLPADPEPSEDLFNGRRRKLAPAGQN